jgi:1-deoxy-D-xylulose-5-phosphate synthase
MVNWKTPFKKIEIGKGRKIKAGKDLAILSIGHPGNMVTKAIESLKEKGIDAAHYDLRFVKPIDEAMLHDVFSTYSKVITVEDGCIMGGMGSAVLEFMADHGYSAKVTRLGIPDKFIEHGEQAELYEECGFSPGKIAESAERILKEHKDKLSQSA